MATKPKKAEKAEKKCPYCGTKVEAEKTCPKCFAALKGDK